jgi:hypothetical protein
MQRGIEIQSLWDADESFTALFVRQGCELLIDIGTAFHGLTRKTAVLGAAHTVGNIHTTPEASNMGSNCRLCST